MAVLLVDSDPIPSHLDLHRPIPIPIPHPVLNSQPVIMHPNLNPSTSLATTPKPSSNIPPTSMLADLALPRPIHPKVAIRMVHTCIKTIMYLRGQMGSTWDQLEHLLQSEQSHQEQELDLEQEQDLEQNNAGHTTNRSNPTHPSIDLNLQSSTATSIADDIYNVLPIATPLKSLREFIQSGEKMFVNLEDSIYSQLYQQLKSRSLTPHQPDLYISLALIFGNSITTPKEQYMVRIGPLEPQQRVGDNPSPQRDNHTPHKPSRDERNWERQLIQQIMGITRIMDDEQELQQYEQATVSSFQALPAINRTRVHLLKKAPAGLVFHGLLPKQMIIVQEDFSLDDIGVRKLSHKQPDQKNINSSGLKKRRWPIHHIHVLGPNTTSTNNFSSSIHVEQTLNTRDEIWYQVGQGIPVLSPLL